MTMPTVPLDATMPVAHSRSYPFFSSSAIMVLPRAAVVAAEEPEMAAKNIPATDTVWARPPVNAPTRDWEKLTSRLVTPPADMKAPASMKNGTAMNEKESIPENIIWDTMTSGLSMKKTRIAAVDRQSENATGTPSAVRRRNKPSRTYSMIVSPLSLRAGEAFYDAHRVLDQVEQHEHAAERDHDIHPAHGDVEAGSHLERHHPRHPGPLDRAG